MGRQDVRRPRSGERAGATRRRSNWAASTWREVTGYVRSITDHVPLTPRARAVRGQRQAVHEEWTSAAERDRIWSDDGDDFAAMDAERAPAATRPARESRGSELRDYPGASRSNRGRSGAPTPSGKQLPAVVLAVLLMVSLVVGCLGSGIMLRGLDLLAAGLDLSTQVTTILDIAKNGGYTQPAELQQMQASLQSINNDLVRVQSDLPISLLEGNRRTGGLVHVLRMTSLLVSAGEYGVDAATVLVPALKGMMSGLGNGTSAPSTAPPVTLTDLERVQFDINVAARLLYQAMQERSLVSDSALQSIGLGKVVSVLHKLDSVRAKLPQYLNDVNYAAAALPALLGLEAPGYAANYLLFDEDSDELRPTGGFLGNYALLTFAKGKLTSGVHLKDIYTLDCPGPGGYPNGCPVRNIPSAYSWLSDDPYHFGVRDSNLDPNFTTSSSYIETNYYNTSYYKQTHQKVDGVIAFTPAFIGRILDLLGGITIPAYGVRVTSANLEDTIHYFHILYAYCENPNYASDARCQQKINGGGAQTSDKKTFDALLGSALLHAVATSGGKVQGEVIKSALQSVQTRDLQIYFNDRQVENMLNLFHADDTIPAVNGDQLLVVDANTGATYASGDLREQINDQITLNADGSASHDMTITYTYPWVSHRYAPIYADATRPNVWNPWQYTGVVLVMVPQSAQENGASNCPWPYYQPQEKDRQVWGCGPINVVCNACNPNDGSNTGAQAQQVTLELRWTVYNAVTTSGSTHTYNLTLVHQAGSHPQVTVTIQAAGGQPLASASPANPSPTKANGGLQYTTGTAVLTTDQTIVVSYRG